jgi:hypothetical protein
MEGSKAKDAKKLAARILAFLPLSDLKEFVKRGKFGALVKWSV